MVCLGAINVDLFYRVESLEPFSALIPGLHRGGEYALTPGQEAQLQRQLARGAIATGRSGGGQAANVAFALARWGIPVALIGRVGADADGDFLRQGLRGVDCRLTCQGSSGRAFILVDSSGERTILVAPNTNDQLTLADIPLELVQDARYLHLTSFVGDGPLQVQRTLLTQLINGPHVCLDPGDLYTRRGRAALMPLLARTDTLLLTEMEWRRLGGNEFTQPTWAPRTVLVKLGARGARLLTEAGAVEIAAEAAITVVDTVGCGDVFAAGWLAGQVAGLASKVAVRLANRLAAASLAGQGRERYPDRNFFEQHLAAVR